MARTRNPNRESIRNARVSLVVPEKTYAGLTTLALLSRTSVNDFVCNLLDSVVRQNSDVIQKFDAAIKDAADDVNLAIEPTNPKE